MNLAADTRVDALDSLPDISLRQGEISRAFRGLGCTDLKDAARFVWHLPYGRNTDRTQYWLVLTEQKGTCSTKHALLAALARELEIDIELVLGLYDMSEQNTPGVGAVLNRHGLSSIPEAHCFLRFHSSIVDITMPPGHAVISKHFYMERTIQPEDIGAVKENFHRLALSNWVRSQKLPDLNIEKAWEIRNACIGALSELNCHGIDR